MQTWKKAENDFEGSFDQFGKRAFVHRVKDTAVAKATGGGFLGAQPADYIVTLDGETFWAEVKSTTDRTSFHFSNIRKQQVAFARMITGAGGTYLFFIKSEELDQWFCVPAPVVFTTLRKKKSMTWHELEPYKHDL